MKKFLLFVFLSFLFLAGCSLYKQIPVYQRSYYGSENKEEAINDVYWWLDAYNAEPIPLEDWITYQQYVEDGYEIERIFQKNYSKDTEIIIVYTTCMCDSLSYHILVKMRTKNKALRMQ
jgi:hypothetical protein